MVVIKGEEPIRQPEKEGTVGRDSPLISKISSQTYFEFSASKITSFSDISVIRRNAKGIIFLKGVFSTRN